MCEHEKPVRVYIFCNRQSPETDFIQLMLEPEEFNIVMVDYEADFQMLFAGSARLKIIVIDDSLGYLDALISNLNNSSYDNIITISDSYDSVRMKFKNFRYYPHFPHLIRPFDDTDLMVAISGCLPRCQ